MAAIPVLTLPSCDFGSRHTGAPILTPLLTCCVTKGKLLHLSVPVSAFKVQLLCIIYNHQDREATYMSIER